MPQGGGLGLVYIGRSVNPKPSDQTDLNKWRRCNLGGGGGTDVEVEADRWAQGACRLAGGAGQPHLVASRPLLRWHGFWCHLEPSGVGFATDKHDLFDVLILLDGFLE
jgi:hypothetical protein